MPNTWQFFSYAGFHKHPPYVKYNFIIPPGERFSKEIFFLCYISLNAVWWTFPVTEIISKYDGHIDNRDFA